LNAALLQINTSPQIAGFFVLIAIRCKHENNRGMPAAIWSTLRIGFPIFTIRIGFIPRDRLLDPIRKGLYRIIQPVSGGNPFFRRRNSQVAYLFVAFRCFHIGLVTSMVTCADLLKICG
jgi:hypothetical protein